MKALTLGTLAALALLPLSGAHAQKSADTLRIPLIEPTAALGNLFTARLEDNFIHQDVYEALLAYDNDQRRIVGQLAQAWKWVDSTTFELDLREGIKYTNGNAFDADDVVHIVNYVADGSNPDTKNIMHGQRRFDWVRGAEKLSPTKVRIKVKQPAPTHELGIALTIPMYDAETAKSLAKVSDYEATAIGTGPYRVIEIDTSRGISATRNDGFTGGPRTPPGSEIRNLRMVFMPSLDTQVASLLAGSIEAAKNLQVDQASDLMSRGFQATPLSEGTLMVMELNSAGRSAQKALKDPRVRRALEMAVDRAALASVSPAGKFGEVMNEMCFRYMVGCVDNATPPPAHNVAAARKLLADAGFPSGFDIVIDSRTLLRDAATALSGMWRQIGVKASVELNAPPVQLKKRAAGEMSVHLTIRPLFSMPDTSIMLDNYFYNTNRDYWQDETINKLGEEALSIMDPAKRDDHYRRILSRINEEAYMLPISSLPVIYIHSKDVKVDTKNYLKQIPAVGNFSWN